MTPQRLLADAVLLTKQLTARYLAGFDDTNHTRQAPSLPNHAAWSLGHCAITMHRVAEAIEKRLDAPAATPSLPTDQFVAGSVADRARYAAESVAFGSRPAASADAYPPMARCLEIYNAACDRLAAAVAASDAAGLARPMKWSGLDTNVWALVVRMVFHNGFHTGEIADLRRATGMKSIFS